MQNEKIRMASAWRYRGGSQAERFSIARIILLCAGLVDIAYCWVGTLVLLGY